MKARKSNHGNPNETLAKAASHLAAGRLEAAAAMYRGVLRAQPGHPEAQHNLGVVEARRGAPEKALRHFEAALAAQPANPQLWISLAKALSATGRLKEARARLEEGVRRGVLPPGAGGMLEAVNQADAQAGAGQAEAGPSPREKQAVASLFAAGRDAEVVHAAREMLDRFPGDVFAWKALGAALARSGKTAEALEALARAAGLMPDDPELQNNYGNALRDAGRLDEAEMAYKRAIAVRPDFADAHSNLANISWDLGRLGEAEAACRRALALAPNHAMALNNLGNVLSRLDRTAEAESLYHQAFEAKPDYVEAYNNLGKLLRKQDRILEAEHYYRKAVAIGPNLGEAHVNLGDVLKMLGRFPDAAARYRRASELDPEDARARLALAMTSLPVVVEDEAASRAAPEAFAAALEELAAWAENGRLDRLGACLGDSQPFHLAYRPGNHVRLLARYGDLAARAGAAWIAGRGGLGLEPPPDRDRPRVVVVSGQVRRHSVFDVLLSGFLRHHDRERLEVVLYHLSPHTDEATAPAASLAARFVQGPKSFDGWLEELRRDRPDAIYYPEIGMEPMATRLAALRLAPVQAVSWGHPVTSGLPTMDLFFSGESLEPENARDAYVERLVRLPGTGACTPREETVAEPADAAALGLPADRNVARFLICQMPFKFDPAHDVLFARIAARAAPCVFVFVKSRKYPWAFDRVMGRLRRVFEAEGLDPDRFLRVVDWMTFERLSGLFEEMDVYLDPPAFSGYTTAWRAAARGLPIVTLEGPDLRQRLAAGLLRRLGLAETVAAEPEAYVAKAVGLARDPEARRELSRRLRAAAPGTDGDLSVIRAMEEAFWAALKRKGRAFPGLAADRPNSPGVS